MNVCVFWFGTPLQFTGHILRLQFLDLLLKASDLVYLLYLLHAELIAKWNGSTGLPFAIYGGIHAATLPTCQRTEIATMERRT